MAEAAEQALEWGNSVAYCRLREQGLRQQSLARLNAFVCRDVVEQAARAAEADSSGLPVGVQIVARHLREDVLLTVIAVLETHFEGRPDYPANPP